jgi:hypothetical protein
MSRVEGSRSGYKLVHGLGFRVQVIGFRLQSIGFTVYGLLFRVEYQYCLNVGFSGVTSLGLQVWGLGVRVKGARFILKVQDHWLPMGYGS